MGNRLEKQCNKCGVLIYWDRDNKTMKETGSWVGDLDKRVHTQDRCREIQGQGKPTTPQTQQTITPEIKSKDLTFLSQTQIDLIKKKTLQLLEVRGLVESLVQGTPLQNNQAGIGQLINLLIDTTPELFKT